MKRFRFMYGNGRHDVTIVADNMFEAMIIFDADSITKTIEELLISEVK